MTTILLMVGNDVLRQQLKDILFCGSYSVLTCRTHEEMVIQIQCSRPSLVLLDATEYGMQMSMALRQNSDTQDIVQMMVTENDTEEHLGRLFSLGIDDVVLRPLRPGELLAKVAHLMQTKRVESGEENLSGDLLFAGHYRILKQLGHGGFGTVYRARDVRNNTYVALKVLRKEQMDRKAILMFFREAYALFSLDHENIVRIIDFGTHSGRYYLCTEYVMGDSLSDLIRNSPVSESFALHILEDILSAFEEMERNHIIHRDVKPHNIMITPEGRCILVDFGLAMDQGQKSLTKADELEGTLAYLSPEYIQHKEHITIKSDIYALGITLYQALSGKLPFDCKTAVILKAQVNEIPEPLSSRVPIVSEAFSSLVDRMMEKDPERRVGIKELHTMIDDCKKGASAAPAAQPRTSLEEASYLYHESPVPGKLKILPSKACEKQDDLSLAYTPGVAFPCLAIQKNPEMSWKYTGRSNTVAVVSDGTAVLGLGNIGPEAGMPVMEGKAVLFKRFADIDAVPLCLGHVFGPNGKSDPKKIIEVVQTFEPSFGGINLEDIGSPACFEVEPALKKSMCIPVFHDDQHGTAIISLAGILNALRVVGKKIGDCRFVMNGAGAAGIACAEYYVSAGAKRENFTLCDSKGVIHSGRTDLNAQKQRFAHETSARTLADAMKGADVFVGVSVAGAVTEEMVASMAKGAVVFAMANPTPEIFPDRALAAGAAVAGTGRSDFCNQVNNVLGFPGIFRGALDVRAKDINEAMKLAASHALAEIVAEKMPADIYKTLCEAYPKDAAMGVFEGESPLKSTYVIPKPFDVRVVPRVARRVAQAAMETGVAQVMIEDLDAYERSVAERISRQK